MLRRIACLLWCLSAIAGCTVVPDRQYHAADVSSEIVYVDKNGGAACTELVRFSCPISKRSPDVPLRLRSTLTERQHWMAWLEVSENGYLFDQKQVSAVTDFIRMQNGAGNGVMVVAFVHGWHDNADATYSAEALQFPLYLGRAAHLADTLVSQEYSSRPVVVLGLYIGWRGETVASTNLLAEIPRYLSFGDRAVAADCVGLGADYRWVKGKTLANYPDDRTPCRDTVSTSAGIKTLRTALQDISKAVDAADTHDEGNRLLLSGVSFGGRIITRMFEDDLARGNFRPLGNNALVVAINAAIGADCYDKAIMANGASQTDVSRPYWIALTSKVDTATDLAYPFARGIGWASPACDPSSPNKDFTIGHGSFSHELRFDYLGTLDQRPARPLSITGFGRGRTMLRELHYDGLGGSSYAVYRMLFTATPTAIASRPLWIVCTDHTAIYSNEHPNGWMEKLQKRHSAVFTTNSLRLWIELLYGPAGMAPEPEQSSEEKLRQIPYKRCT